jgi:hypothetical protein
MPPPVTINGKAVRPLPGAFHEPLIPLLYLCEALKAKLEPVPGSSKAFQITLQDRWERLDLNSRNILCRSGEGKRVLDLLPDAPVKRGNDVWIPVAAARFLGATVMHSAAGYEITYAGDDSVDGWKRLLAIPSSFAPTGHDFAISRVEVRPDSGVTEGAEVVINVVDSPPGYLQIYEVHEGSAEPVIGVDSDEIVFFPRHRGLPPHPISIAGRMRVRIHVTGAGLFWYVAVVTRRQQQNDLLAQLRKGEIAGEWDIRGARLDVKERSAR